MWQLEIHDLSQQQWARHDEVGFGIYHGNYPTSVVANTIPTDFTAFVRNDQS